MKLTLFIYLNHLHLYSSDPNGPWCPGNQGQPGQGLSVVTTVWGMTNTTQTAPFNHQTPGYTTTMSSTNYTQQPQGFQVNSSLQKGQYNPPNNIPYRRPRYVIHVVLWGRTRHIPTSNWHFIEHVVQRIFFLDTVWF